MPIQRKGRGGISITHCENWMMSLLVTVFCGLALTITLIIKRKTARSIVIMISIVTAIPVFVGGGYIYGSKKVYIENFSVFTTDELLRLNEVIDTSLNAEIERSGHILSSTDELDSRIIIDSFDCHFAENVFSNLQFTILIHENGSAFEENYQINYTGQFFTTPKVLSLVERDYDNALPLRELTEVITAISKSNVFHAISATVPNGIDIMFNGYTERLSETEAIPIIYIIQGEDIVPISPDIFYQESNGYYVFSIVSENDYIQILYV